jgi:hypothetical protein
MTTYKKTIEQLIKQWNKINSINEWNIWADNVLNTKFGTYGTISIFEVIKNTDVKFINSFVKDSFINECKDALNGFKHQK